MEFPALPCSLDDEEHQIHFSTDASFQANESDTEKSENFCGELFKFLPNRKVFTYEEVLQRVINHPAKAAAVKEL